MDKYANCNALNSKHVFPNASTVHLLETSAHLEASFYNVDAVQLQVKNVNLVRSYNATTMTYFETTRVYSPMHLRASAGNLRIFGLVLNVNKVKYAYVQQACKPSASTPSH